MATDKSLLNYRQLWTASRSLGVTRSIPHLF